MGEGEGGGEGSVTEGTLCCEVPCVNAVHFRCVILEIENERRIFEIWVLACQDGKCGIFLGILEHFCLKIYMQYLFLYSWASSKVF